MEGYGAAVVIVWILGIILAIMALLMPVYVYQIRNRCLNMDKKMATIIELLGGRKGQASITNRQSSINNPKTCPFCKTENQPADQVCKGCGMAMGL